MFERRLRIILALPATAALIIAARLYQLQILRGEEYLRRADAALVSPRQFLPPLRGRILDRAGAVLVSDEPAHDVTIHYGALSMRASYLHLLADGIRRKDPAWRRATDADVADEARRRIARMWLVLSRVSGVPMAELRRRRDALCDTVEGLRRHIWKARRQMGYEEPLDKLRLSEEGLFHPILRDISPELRTKIELELADLPFLRVEPSVRRVWREGTRSLCHVLGNLGQVTADRMSRDPSADDPLAAYRPGDEAGVSGVEMLAESMLRGKRGFEERFLDGSLRDRVAPVDGLDVQLTIDLGLQNDIVAVLERAVAEHPPATGAACVVLDVRSREILALVSVPTYDRARLRTDYAALRDDAAARPLLFRAVAEEYQPGSIVKPLAMLAAWSHGLVDPQQAVLCTGQLFEDSDKWHCWTHWRGLPGHGPVNAVEAIQHSCNVYFYTLGQRLGAARLTDFFRDVLCGPADRRQEGRPVQSTGLPEERAGLIPSRDWLRAERRRDFTPADGRNYAIGQGELQITPLQAANIFATLASGESRAPTLIANDGGERPVRRCAPTGGTAAEHPAWQSIRRGLHKCVNEEGGTAFRYVHMKELAICGKTGSAQCVSRVTRRRYLFDAPDGGEALSIVAPTIEAARERLGLPASVRCIRSEVVERWPPPDAARGEVPTHAWFAGYAPHGRPKIALAVIIEYGGGGGSAAGPAAKDVFRALISRGYLRAEHDVRIAGGAAAADE